MNDFPGGYSRRAKTPLAPELEAEMKALQMKHKGDSPWQLAAIEPRHGFLKDGTTEVTTKFVEAKEQVASISGRFPVEAP